MPFDQNANARKQRERRRAQGLCLSCNSAAEPGKTHCKRCVRKAVLAQSQKRAERKARGLCVICGKAPADSGFVSCVACRQRANEANRRWAEKQRCSGS